MELRFLLLSFYVPVESLGQPFGRPLTSFGKLSEEYRRVAQRGVLALATGTVWSRHGSESEIKN